MPFSITVTRHALLRYAERCYGELYRSIDEIPMVRTRQFIREIHEHVCKGVRLSKEQAERFHALWPYPRISERSRSGTLYYREQSIFVIESHPNNRMYVITVLEAAPLQLRYLEEIGFRVKMRSARPATVLNSYAWLRTYAQIEIMFMGHAIDSLHDVSSEHVRLWLQRVDRIEREKGNHHYERNRRLYVDERMRREVASVVSKSMNPRVLISREDVESDASWESWKRVVREVNSVRYVLCTPERAVTFLRDVVYESEQLPTEVLEAPIRPGTVLGFDPDARGTYAYRLLHVPSEQ